MRISESVVHRLVDHDIRVIFGIPGTQTLPLNEEIDSTTDIRYVMARHETAVSHQAWGYAETTGQPAATLVVPGPGDMNAMNGLKNALNDCTPLIHISIETDPAIRGGGGIHETPPDTYDNVVKANLLVENPETATATVERALAIATTPPKGPVRIGIPKPFLTQEVSSVESGEFDKSYFTNVPKEKVTEAVDLLAEGSSPIIVAGGGVRAASASHELRSVAEALSAPVITTYKGKGVLPEDHELSAGVLCSASSIALIDCIDAADVALGIGTDFDAVSTQQWSFNIPDSLVHVTIDETDIGTRYTPEIGIVADAKKTLQAMDELLADRSVRSDDGVDRARTVRQWDADRMEPLQSIDNPPITSASALAAIRLELPDDGIVTVDAGGFRLWTLVSFPAFGPRRYINPGSWASMGTSLPSAIGAQVAHPETPVLSLNGDGGLMMSIHELHTVVAEELPLTVVVFQNNDYAVISEIAKLDHRLPEGEYAWDGNPIDFVTIAEGMGMEGIQANTPALIREAVRTAVTSEDPTLIQVETDPREPQANSWMTREE